jgi:hypothetical protein
VTRKLSVSLCVFIAPLAAASVSARTLRRCTEREMSPLQAVHCALPQRRPTHLNVAQNALCKAATWCTGSTPISPSPHLQAGCCACNSLPCGQRKRISVTAVHHILALEGRFRVEVRVTCRVSCIRGWCDAPWEDALGSGSLAAQLPLRCSFVSQGYALGLRAQVPRPKQMLVGPEIFNCQVCASWY